MEPAPMISVQHRVGRPHAVSGDSHTNVMQGVSEYGMMPRGRLPVGVTVADARSLIAMPELPEVETIRRGLLQRLVGHQIVGLRVRQVYLREKVEVDTLQAQVVG